MRDPLDDLHQLLLRGGVSRRHANRLVRELADHAEDLADSFAASGMTREAARIAALQRLGAPDEIAAPILADRRFQSIFTRAPALVCLAAPLFCQLVLTAFSAIALMLVARSGAVDPGMLAEVLSLALLLPPVALAWSLAWTGWRHRSTSLWPLVGAGAIVLAGVSTSLSVGMSQAGEGGYIAIALGLPDLLTTIAVGTAALAPHILLNRPKAQRHA